MMKKAKERRKGISHKAGSFLNGDGPATWYKQTVRMDTAHLYYLGNLFLSRTRSKLDYCACESLRTNSTRALDVTITFNQHPRLPLISRKKTHLTGLPDIPFSLYGYGRVNSIDPAMSICAQRIGASPPSLASMPSTNAFKNNAAVQLPPGLPPVCFISH